MEDFNVSYYAHHTRFLLSLFNNHSKMTTLGPCQKEFDLVSKETLLRDFSSRVFYTSFLKARYEMSLGERAMHETVEAQLETKYKLMFKEMKKLRVEADYKSDNDFTPFLLGENIAKHYPFRLLQMMETFLGLTGEELSKNHVLLEENRKRNKI